MKRFLRFLIAGGGGFLVDALVLAALMRFTPLGPFPARAIAITLAMGFTFIVNRHFTFERSSRRLLSQGLRYGTVGTVSALTNYALFCALLITMPALQPLVALVLASVAAMGLSFIGYSRLVFTQR